MPINIISSSLTLIKWLQKHLSSDRRSLIEDVATLATRDSLNFAIKIVILSDKHRGRVHILRPLYQDQNKDQVLIHPCIWIVLGRASVGILEQENSVERTCLAVVLEQNINLVLTVTNQPSEVCFFLGNCRGLRLN